MSAREVAINVTENIRQMDRSKRVTKNCINQQCPDLEADELLGGVQSKNPEEVDVTR